VGAPELDGARAGQVPVNGGSGGLPFEMRSEPPSCEALSARAYKAPLNADGVAVLPAEWDDDE